MADESVLVIIVSDRVLSGERPDRAGERLAQLWRAAGLRVSGPRVIPEGADSVALALRAALAEGHRVVLTAGGTGIRAEDRVPEETAAVLTRELPGVAEHLRREGARHTPLAALSRGRIGVVDDTAGRPRTLVVNLPGSLAGVEQGTEALLPLLGHLLRQFDEPA